MTLALDIGNTAVKGGLFDDDDLVRTFRFETDAGASVPAYRHALRHRLGGDEVQRAGIASVVPAVTQRLAEAVHAETLALPLVVQPTLALPFDLAYETPETLGTDRLAAAAGAHALFRAEHDGPLVTVDAGTAVTVEVVSADDVFLGGAIGVGPDLVRRALARDTAQLPDVPPALPRRAIGRSTRGSIQSGLLFPFLDGVRGLLTRIIDELDGQPLVVATGGWGALLTEHLDAIDRVEPNLVLHGVRVLLDLNP